jgi:hypothetical protein
MSGKEKPEKGGMRRKLMRGKEGKRKAEWEGKGKTLVSFRQTLVSSPS